MSVAAALLTVALVAQGTPSQATDPIELVKQGTFPDPISTCGTPHGFPRLMNLPDLYEFVVTPQQVIVLGENGPNVLRVYTDGRSHPAPEDLWPTYSGSSVGHWEGDTLVFTTISMKGFSGKDVIELQRTVRAVPVPRHVQDYAVRLLMATHPELPGATAKVKRFVSTGGSPRGAQALLLGAKIRALFANRFAPSLDDVRAVAKPALRPRVLLNFEGEAESVTTDAVIDEILAELPETVA